MESSGDRHGNYYVLAFARRMRPVSCRVGREVGPTPKSKQSASWLRLSLASLWDISGRFAQGPSLVLAMAATTEDR